MTQAALAKTKEASNSADRQDWSAHDNCEHIPNAETIAAFEETEEIVKRIRSGDYSGCMTYEEFLADLYSDDDDEDEV